MSTPARRTVKVAEYRQDTEHLLRIANVDYHACVGTREIAYWKETAARVLAQVTVLQCTRATAYDREQFAKAVAAVESQLFNADARIAKAFAERQRDANNIHRN